MKKTAALIFAASTLFLAGCCTTHGPASTKWEYKTVYDISQVNQLAGQGWSLAGFSAFHDGGTSGTLYVMKHPKQ